MLFSTTGPCWNGQDEKGYQKENQINYLRKQCSSSWGMCELYFDKWRNMFFQVKCKLIRNNIMCGGSRN